MAPAAANWIVSETTSPLDYTPVAIATALSSGGPDRAILQLSIQCRGGRTDLVIMGPALIRRGENYVVSYSVNDGPPVMVASGTLACPECDAPVFPGDRPVSPAAPLACPFCGQSGAVRDFLSLAPPSRPARVVVRVRHR